MIVAGYHDWRQPVLAILNQSLLHHNHVILFQSLQNGARIAETRRLWRRVAVRPMKRTEKLGAPSGIHR